MSSRSRTGLMLVDDPQLLFKSLCSLADRSFTAQDYWQVLGSMTSKGKVHVKTRDTHFYTASILKLIKATNTRSHEYHLTPIAKKICGVFEDKSRIAIYRQYLRSLLLTNSDKGFLFKKFIRYTSRPRSLAEIRRNFGEVPSKTLIAFCVEAGLSVEHGGLIRSIEARSSVDIGDFYSALVRIYDDLRKNSDKGLHVPYVSVDLLRDLVSLELALESSDLFDTLLTRTIESSHGSIIYLHGAPPQSESEFVGFRFKGKRYAYVSLRNSS